MSMHRHPIASCKKEAWAAFVRERRLALRLTKRQVSKLANVDATYLTRMEVDGYVPSGDVVRRVANALGADVQMALAYAGYLPDELTVVDVRLALEAKRLKRRDALARRLEVPA